MGYGKNMFLDDEMQVESAGVFLDSLDDEELIFARQNMVPCRCCGELRLSSGLNHSGLCNLCSTSEIHYEYRRTSPQAVQKFSEMESRWEQFLD